MNVVWEFSVYDQSINGGGTVKILRKLERSRIVVRFLPTTALWIKSALNLSWCHGGYIKKACNEKNYKS